MSPDPEASLLADLDAHDALVERCARGDISWDEFDAAYDAFYMRAALDGHESNAHEQKLLDKHANRIALHRDVWEDVLTKVTSVELARAHPGWFGPVEAVERLRALVARYRPK